MTAPTTACQLAMPNLERFFDQVIANHRGAVDVCVPGSRAGRAVVICGAGPSLRDAVLPEADEVWACNSALPWLWDRGVRVTHGVTIDQGEAMAGPGEFGRALPVAYLLGSAVHPALVARLRAAGRAVTFFHSFLGIPAPADWAPRPGFASYEDWLYRKLYPTTLCVGSGLNTVPRAIALAVGLGFARIDVYGADCAARPGVPPVPAPPGTAAYADWLDACVFYADGRTARVYGDAAPMLVAELAGRRWATRPDLVMSARHLLELERDHAGRVTCHGDTLVEALRDCDPARLPALDNVHARVTNLALPTYAEAAA
jgi:hypothetical protein